MTVPSRPATSDVADRWLAAIANPVKLAIIRALVAADYATVGELTQSCETSTPTLRRHLDAMVAIGIISEENGESDGLTAGRPATRYSLPLPISESVRRVLSQNT